MQKRGKASPAVEKRIRALLEANNSLASTALVTGMGVGVVRRIRQRMNDERDGTAVHVRERPCITCSRPFRSTGNHHRMCPRCRSEASEETDYSIAI